jgi:hypothetical protein
VTNDDLSFATSTFTKQSLAQNSMQHCIILDNKPYVMTIEAVKAQLHEYIEHASENKIMALFTLLHEDVAQGFMLYDEATLNMLETRYDNMISGKDKTYTLEQTIDNIRQYRKQQSV